MTDTANNILKLALTLTYFNLSYFPLQNAAKRMVAFWAMRSNICGEAAFLPLVATGHGALNAEAISLLNDGYVVRLLDDKEGRAVLFIDRSRFQHGSEFRNAILQLILYMLCAIVAEEEEEKEESPRKKGYVLVVNGKVRPAPGLFSEIQFDFCPISDNLHCVV
jgi:hypothetical protein